MSSDQLIFERQGFGGSLSHGPSFALLIVDFVNGFVKPEAFGGFNTATAARNTVQLLARCRALGWVVAHSRIVYSSSGCDANVFSEKVPSILSLIEANPDSQIIDDLKPMPNELVVCKTAPSAFFGTGLATFFTTHQIKTIVIAGATTSGCVRASVVDAMSHGFKPLVISDCVGDRVETAHQLSLRDMDMKYADLMSLGEFLGQFSV